MPRKVEKPILQYQTDPKLVELRNIFARLMVLNCYSPEDANRLDRLLELAYKSGKLAGIDKLLAL